MTYQIYIYTLALEDGFYYVGKTVNPERRFNEHFNDKGAVWTKLHPPIEVVSTESFIVSSIEQEDRWENHQTIKMMRAKGWSRVRGGVWCTVGEIETIKHLQHYGFFLDIDIANLSLSKREQYVYILELENNKYYVGSSRSLQLASKNHEKGKASKWTHTHKPIKLLEYEKVIFENGIPDINLVNDWVVKYGEKYGYENIRGGSLVLFETKSHLELIRSYLNKRCENQHDFNDVLRSRFIKEYEDNNTVIDYELPLKDNERIIVIYVMELQDEYFHVSYTSDLAALMLKYERGKCCEWCKLHSPVKLIEVIPLICPKDYLEIIDQLDPIVAKYFNKYGADKVRGGRFTCIDEKLHTKKVLKMAGLADEKSTFNILKEKI